MAIQGIITDIGIVKSADAENNQGWKILPTRFGISTTQDALDPTRTIPNANQWYKELISSVVIVDTHTLKFICTIPPNQALARTDIKEIYLYAEDYLGNEFLLAIGHPQQTIEYDPTGSTILRLQVSITNVDMTSVYAWSYTQATEIAEHDENCNAHPCIQIKYDSLIDQLLQKHGTILTGGGQIDFLSDTLSWTEEFELVNSFYGTSYISAGSMPAINNDEILYVKYFRPDRFTADGTADGKIEVFNADNYIVGDKVSIGSFGSSKIEGYVASKIGEILTIHNVYPAGSPLNLLSYQMQEKAWVQKINLEMQKGTQNTGDLRHDSVGVIDRDVSIFAVRKDNYMIFANGDKIARVWNYEESMVVTTEYDFDDIITIPLDSRNGNNVTKYRVSRGHVQMYVNGFREYQDQVLIAGSFDPLGYNAGTGIVTVPDGVDLSRLTIKDIFRDANSTEFTVLGGVVETPGNKQFQIHIGQVVDLGLGALLIRQGFAEIGSEDTWSKEIQTRKNIPVNAVITFRIEPLEKTGGSLTAGAGAVGTLQDAYNNGNTITTTTGRPIILIGPSGEKLLEIIGDMKLTGVLDPKGIGFSREASHPLPANQDGLWNDIDGNLMYRNYETGDAQIGGTSTYTNNTGGNLYKGRMVRITAVGKVDYADWTTQVQSRAIGILLNDSVHGAKTRVKKVGYVRPGIVGTNDFIENIFPSEGEDIYLGEIDGKMTVTPPAELSGLIQKYVGVWDNAGINLQIGFPVGKV